MQPKKREYSSADLATCRAREAQLIVEAERAAEILHESRREARRLEVAEYAKWRAETRARLVSRETGVSNAIRG